MNQEQLSFLELESLILSHGDTCSNKSVELLVGRIIQFYHLPNE